MAFAVRKHGAPFTSVAEQGLAAAVGLDGDGAFADVGAHSVRINTGQEVGAAHANGSNRGVQSVALRLTMRRLARDLAHGAAQ